MSATPPPEFERLVTQCRATLDSPSGNSLRADQILLLFRQLIPECEKQLERTHARESFTTGCLRHLKNIFGASSGGSNGKRSWHRNLDQDLKTALISAHSFIHRHK